MIPQMCIISQDFLKKNPTFKENMVILRNQFLWSSSWETLVLVNVFQKLLLESAAAASEGKLLEM